MGLQFFYACWVMTFHQAPWVAGPSSALLCLLPSVAWRLQAGLVAWGPQRRQHGEVQTCGAPGLRKSVYHELWQGPVLKDTPINLKAPKAEGRASLWSNQGWGWRDHPYRPALRGIRESTEAPANRETNGPRVLHQEVTNWSSTQPMEFFPFFPSLAFFYQKTMLAVTRAGIF